MVALRRLKMSAPRGHILQAAHLCVKLLQPSESPVSQPLAGASELQNASSDANSTPQQMVEHWRKIIQGDAKSWVLFANGTCVILMLPESDLAKQATDLLREWGPVHIGSPAGDFTVSHLSNYPGWVIYGHHPDIINYVSPTEVPANSGDASIGILGRGRRNLDGLDPVAVHVEDRRNGKIALR